MNKAFTEYELRQAMIEESGAKPIPDDCPRIGSYADDYPGTRPAPDGGEGLVHGADPNSPEWGTPKALPE
jgi:hypothetical protein